MGEISIKHIASCAYFFFFALCPEKLQYTQYYFRSCCAIRDLGAFLDMFGMSKLCYWYHTSQYGAFSFFRDKV